jgi:hypothetical protein
MKIKKGKTAVKKEKAIPPALEVRAPLRIPMTYILNRSYKVNPDKPGILINLEYFKIILMIKYV